MLCVSTSGDINTRGGEELFKLVDNVGMRTSEYKHTINKLSLEIRFLITAHSLKQIACIHTHKKSRLVVKRVLDSSE